MSETNHENTPGNDTASADPELEGEQSAPSDPANGSGEASSTEGDATAERSDEELKRAAESLIFVADRAVTALQLGRVLKLRVAHVRELIAALERDYEGRGIEIVEVGGGYQFRSSPQNAEYVRSLLAQRPVRLTRAQLETLALVAYRQPITRPEIDDVRGVDSGSAVRVLLERGLLKMLGRKDEPGRPLLYGTTPHFLEFFGMNSLKDLPTLREFTELTEENRALFQRKTGENIEDIEEELAAAESASEETSPDLEASDELAADAASTVEPEAGSEPETDASPDSEAPQETEPLDESAREPAQGVDEHY